MMRRIGIIELPVDAADDISNIDKVLTTVAKKFEEKKFKVKLDLVSEGHVNVSGPVDGPAPVIRRIRMDIYGDEKVAEHETEKVAEPGTVALAEPGTVALAEPGTVALAEPGTVALAEPGRVDEKGKPGKVDGQVDDPGKVAEPGKVAKPSSNKRKRGSIEDSNILLGHVRDAILKPGIYRIWKEVTRGYPHLDPESAKDRLKISEEWKAMVNEAKTQTPSEGGPDAMNKYMKAQVLVWQGVMEKMKMPGRNN